MGYETRFELSHDKVLDKEKLIIDLGEVTGYSWDKYLELTGKWYDHRKHMEIISKRYPEVTFYLDGDGEETGDMWKSIWRNGKSDFVKAEMTFRKFDMSKLD